LVRPGESLAAARRAARVGHGFHVGLNFWYFASHGSITGLLKVRHGRVEEIGIVNRTLAYNHRAQRILVRSFY
jgi:hypothetical protein